MLAGLGAQTAFCEAPFAPEGGAYGGGPTYGHDHTDHGTATATATGTSPAIPTPGGRSDS